MRSRLIAFFAVSLLFITITIAIANASPDQARAIRVGLTYGVALPSSALINGEGSAASARHAFDFIGTVSVKVRGGSLVASYRDQETDIGSWMEFTPAASKPWLEFNHAAYRGALRLEAVGQDRLRVINTVDIEDYVRGVVPNEMFADLEAYKVQAVISRTYAIYVRDAERKHKADGFDICTTGHCQVYRGMDSERPLSDQAVETTRGQVLTYQGRPILAAYSSNAGGITQPVDEAWPGSIRANFPYLCSVSSPYDNQAQDLQGFSWCYRWERDVTSAEITKRLRAKGKEVGEVKALVITETTSTQRARKMDVIGSAAVFRLTTPTEIREALGTPSERLTLSRTNDGFHVTGWGFGHAVGLSQHGALGMAKAGFSYQQILGHYYREVALTEDYAYGPTHALTPPEITMESAQARPAPVPADIG